MKAGVAYITICSAEKSSEPGQVAAIKRYRSRRIDQVFARSRKDDAGFRILSGKYGLLDPEAPIPYYDQLLTADSVGAMTMVVKDQLEADRMGKVIFYGVDPAKDNRWRAYYQVMQAACSAAKVALEIRYIDEEGMPGGG